MRAMDGIMAIPSILLAIALITLTRPGLGIVIAVVVVAIATYLAYRIAERERGIKSRAF